MKTWIIAAVLLAIVQVTVGGMLVHKVENMAAAHAAAMQTAIRSAK